jgi:hypothetical protein
LKHFQALAAPILTIAATTQPAPPPLTITQAVQLARLQT